tara:strand:- start:1001 stop:1681 length:681 start_codon:yes stop_codon:yes gene_type:complete
MTKTLTVKTRGIVPAGSRLARSVLELHETLVDAYEAFFRRGCILDRIRTDREFEDAGYDDFSSFMNAVQPCGIQRDQARRLIEAKNIRPDLPALPHSDAPVGASEWSERTIRPLTKLDEPYKWKRVSKRVVAAVKKGEAFNAKLVQREVDRFTGADVERAEKKAAKVRAADTPGDVIRNIAFDTNQWLESLENATQEFWDDAEEQRPGCVKEAAKALSKLSLFLRS